jgi:hypothetical protein
VRVDTELKLLAAMNAMRKSPSWARMRTRAIIATQRAITEGKKPEDLEVWQMAFRVALRLSDVSTLCALTQHWDWKGIHTSLYQQLTGVLKKICGS